MNRSDRGNAPFTVFMGGPTCAYHNLMGMDMSRTVFIVAHKDDVADEKIAKMIHDEVGRMARFENADRARVFTSCFGEFIDLDYEKICEDISRSVGIDCRHEKRCRICMDPGRFSHGAGPQGERSGARGTGNAFQGADRALHGKAPTNQRSGPDGGRAMGGPFHGPGKVRGGEAGFARRRGAPKRGFQSLREGASHV